MPYHFKYRRPVEFAETDMAGIMHFSNYFRFMESAEHAFFNSLGLTVFEPGNPSSMAWPRVHAQCSYKRPLKFMDLVEIEVMVLEKTRSTVTLGYVLRRAADGMEAAYGTARVASAKFSADDGRLRSIPLPPEVDEALEVAPESLRATVRS